MTCGANHHSLGMITFSSFFIFYLSIISLSLSVHDVECSRIPLSHSRSDNRVSPTGADVVRLLHLEDYQSYISEPFVRQKARELYKEYSLSTVLDWSARYTGFGAGDPSAGTVQYIKLHWLSVCRSVCAVIDSSFFTWLDGHRVLVLLLYAAIVLSCLCLAQNSQEAAITRHTHGAMGI